MINNSNNIFGSSYSNSNPFGGINQNNPQTAYENLMQAYNTKLEALKKQQAQFNIQPQSTVFTDIAFEFKNLPEDEVNFIVNSEEYQTLNSRYQAEFSQFLINKFSNEYLQSNTSGTLEQMLNVIRKQKENYNKKFELDIDEIRGQNKTLMDKNNELAESNAKLQEQLKKIQERLNDYD